VRLDKVCRLNGSLGVLFDPEAAACPGQPGDHQSVPGAQDLEEKKTGWAGSGSSKWCKFVKTLIHFERLRPSTDPFWASTASEFVLWCGSGSIASFHSKCGSGSRSFPKIMRFCGHLYLDPPPWSRIIHFTRLHRTLGQAKNFTFCFKEFQSFQILILCVSQLLFGYGH
jgi:hypothetical protein